jgi:hypothetical protein
MARYGRNREGRTWIISILLMALTVRAFLPAGFMPSADEPFSLQICPDGFPAQLLHNQHAFHHEHAGSHQHNPDDSAGGTHQHDLSRSEHCVFAAAPGVGPTPHVLTSGAWSDGYTLALVSALPAPFTHARYYIPQPRGPPSRV